MKHTPGPWVVDEIEGEDFQGRIMAGNLIIAGRHEHRRGLGNIHHEGNAHLIAAAPDLLEALKDLVARYEGLIIGDPKEQALCYSKNAYAAIEKAQGQMV